MLCCGPLIKSQHHDVRMNKVLSHSAHGNEIGIVAKSVLHLLETRHVGSLSVTRHVNRGTEGEIDNLSLCQDL